MEEGYLIIETHPERPGLVRIRNEKEAPDKLEPGEQAGPRACYVGRFNDLSAAQMQVHARLRRRLVDSEAGFYRTDPITAVAAAESLPLRHRQVYLDPGLVDNSDLDRAIEKNLWRHRLTDRFWQAVGVAAVILLVLKVLFDF